jgi:Ca2+/H+ antiporter, TMEM165/GDT1 family
MEAFLASFGMVAIAEMGDKTQLLSFLLATRFTGRHGAIIAGIFVATIANHFVAAFLGDWVAANVSADVMRWILGLAFLAFAGWALIPDKLDDADAKTNKYGPFLTTLVSFFLAEMGDKTQVATIALAARYPSLVQVVAGTTLGMLAANMPVVFFGDAIARRVPLVIVRRITAVAFAVLGILALVAA